MQLAFSIRAKGGAGLAARARTIVERFGVTADRTESTLRLYSEIVEEAGAHPTLPITAAVLRRHPDLIRRFSDRGVEFALHGLVHNDHAGLGYDEQRASMIQGLSIFRRAGVPCVGFRGPYLRFNAATDAAIRSLGLQYHSSQAVSFPVLPADIELNPGFRAYLLALQLYTPLDATRAVARPRYADGLVSIPVAIPDDEIMVDRLNFGNEAQTRAWLSILDTTWHTGELFTVQLHPERIFAMADALRSVLREAVQRRPKVWIPRLDELTGWWQRRRAARLTVQSVGEQRYRVELDGPPEATLLIRDAPGVSTQAWYGRDQVVSERQFSFASPVRPCVGMSRGTPEHVAGFLRDEGYLVERCDDGSGFAAFIDLPAEASPDERTVLAEIERSSGPLVRLWRWPSEARSALAVTGDIDSITLQDFALRVWETRASRSSSGGQRGYP